MSAEKLPAIMFYPSDWMFDSVAGCSIAAQGLWLRIMFLLHGSTRYGYLEMNGSPIPSGFVAQRCGVTQEQYETLLSELVTAGVPSFTQAGVLYSRRMVKDAKLREERRNAGSKGGRARSKSQAKSNQSNEDENEVGIAFEKFWEVFPKYRKGSKQRAREAFVEAAGKAAPDVIVAAAQEYALSEIGTSEYVRMAVTWLNQEGWTDDPASWMDAHKERTWHPVSADNFREMVKRKKFAEGFPQRDKTNLSRVYGKLRDGRQVECLDYPLPQETART